VSDAVKLANGIVEAENDGSSIIVAYSVCLALARAVLAQNEELRVLRRMATACPCHHTTPCSDAVKLARQLIADGLPTYTDDLDVLARAVVAQDEELAKLRAALTEALRGWSYSTAPEHEDVKARIAELLRLTNGE
jgi:hypothetical protein